MSSKRKVDFHSQDLLDANLNNEQKPWTNCLIVNPVNDEYLSKVKPNMTVLPKNSTALSKVKSFLPKLECANKELFHKLEQNPTSSKDFDIENTEGNSNIIEMDVSLVEDLKQTAIDQLLLELSDSSEDDDTSEDDGN